jgi:hypothetical protein
MAGSKTQNKNKNAGKRGTTQRDRFLKGTDEPVLRIMFVRGKKRFVWGVKNPNGGYRHVDENETELR